MFKIGNAIWQQWKADAEAPPKDNAVILRAGQPIASWNYQTTTRIDSKTLREQMPDVFTKFSKSTPSRVLRIKKPK